jgi:hypothetical protein
VKIAGNGVSGLLAGVGKYLRTCAYDAVGLGPSSWRGESVAVGDMRGMYFATHFLNWYQAASDDEVTGYIEDLALWGVNNIVLTFPVIHATGWDDPETGVFFDRYALCARICRDLGVRIGLICVPNQDFRQPRP